MTEEAKIGRPDEAIAIVSSGTKYRVKRGERFSKNWKLGRDIHSEIEWNIVHARMPRRAFFYLFSSPSHPSVRILFRLPNFATTLQEKPSCRKIISPP